ncbi:platelet glycoprotein V-like [Pelobates fuscus]|uniref:platelet glycoprotein V-like n=1 Tax=Pelobates fuscus TaxID=191477 RepID=UPI002FE4523B
MKMIFFFFLSVPNVLLVGASCPAMCSCLVKDKVFCTGRDIADFAKLAIPYNYTSIIIKNTLASELSEDSFQPTDVTSRLALDSNQISIVTVGAFKGFTILHSIKLTDNKIKSLPPGVFDSLKSLIQLFLDKNELTQIDEYLFSHLEKLEELSLNRNYLAQLPDGLLSRLKSLRVLNLSRNKLSTLPRSLFSSLINLEYLYLYNNMLTEINNWNFINLGDLIELALYGNKIQTISKDAFSYSPNLKTLTLSRNQLKTLPDGLFLHLPEITMLTLYDNPLTEFPTVLFGRMDNLQSLWIYHTDLETVPSLVFSNLTNLQLLVLTRNPKLHSLPKDAFHGLSNVLELSLHSNNLTFLEEGIFEDLQSLKNLSLFNNYFEVLQGNLFGSLQNIQYVYLNNCRLQTLPGDLFKGLPSLQIVRLDGNPWACDCNLLDFIAWLRQNMNQVHDAMSLVCRTPFKLMNIPVLNASESICRHTTTREIHSSSQLVSSSPYTWWTTSGDTKVTKSIHEVKSSTAGVEPSTSTVSTMTHVHTTTKVLNHEETSSDVHQMGTTMDSNVTDSSKHLIVTYDKEPFSYIMPYSKMILFFLFLTPLLQLLLIFLTCFGLFTIKRLYSYFDTLAQPAVVLLRVLIPLGSNPHSLSFY